MRQPSFDNETKAEKWRGPYVQLKELQDAWGNKLQYEMLESGSRTSSGVPFKLWSNGSDQQSNTNDDIRNWEEQTAG